MKASVPEKMFYIFIIAYKNITKEPNNDEVKKEKNQNVLIDFIELQP